MTVRTKAEPFFSSMFTPSRTQPAQLSERLTPERTAAGRLVHEGLVHEGLVHEGLVHEGLAHEHSSVEQTAPAETVSARFPAFARLGSGDDRRADERRRAFSEHSRDVAARTPVEEITPEQRADAALLAEVRKYPDRAMAMLHDRFAVEVNDLVWRLLGPDQDHHDIVHEIFYLLLTRFKDVREPEKLAGWVRVVTVNAVRAELRKRTFRRLWFASDRDTAEPAVDALSSLEARDMVRRIKSTLDSMPVNERLVFVLRFVEGYQMQHVAELCRCSLTTAKRALRRAVKRFVALSNTNPELAERILQMTQSRRVGLSGLETYDE